MHQTTSTVPQTLSPTVVDGLILAQVPQDDEPRRRFVGSSPRCRARSIPTSRHIRAAARTPSTVEHPIAHAV